jgi:hypothetical protein
MVVVPADIVRIVDVVVVVAGEGRRVEIHP